METLTALTTPVLAYVALTAGAFAGGVVLGCLITLRLSGRPAVILPWVTDPERSRHQFSPAVVARDEDQEAQMERLAKERYFDGPDGLGK